VKSKDKIFDNFAITKIYLTIQMSYSNYMLKLKLKKYNLYQTAKMTKSNVSFIKAIYEA
jgi:hypothetical protein